MHGAEPPHAIHHSLQIALVGQQIEVHRRLVRQSADRSFTSPVSE